jgi:hypothetical protein
MARPPPLGNQKNDIGNDKPYYSGNNVQQFKIPTRYPYLLDFGQDDSDPAEDQITFKFENADREQTENKKYYEMINFVDREFLDLRGFQCRIAGKHENDSGPDDQDGPLYPPVQSCSQRWMIR